MEELIETLKNRRIGIQFLLKMIPLDLWDWKPDSSLKIRTISELGNHIACSPLILLECIQNKVGDMEAISSIEKNNMPLKAEGLTKLYDYSLNKLLSYLEEHIEDGREENIEVFWKKRPTSIYREIFEEIGHEWFHCGQLFAYLRQNNIPVDMNSYYGIKDPDPSIPPTKEEIQAR